MKTLLNEYEIFKLMVLSTTMLGNTLTDSWSSSSKKIIDFIGKSYEQEPALIRRCEDLILKDLSQVSTISDANLIMANPIDDQTREESIVFNIKSSTIKQLHNFSNDSDSNWLDYQYYHVYHPHLNFVHVNDASRTGNLIACRHIGILYALGLGCAVNYDKAILRLKQAAYWGDISSLYLLAYTYKVTGNHTLANIYKEVSLLCKEYLNDGLTVLPDSVRTSTSKEAYTEFVLISSIFQDIVRSRNQSTNLIDYSFLEVIFMTNLSFNDKMRYINNYQDYRWREVTNTSNEPSRFIGF